MWSRFGAVVRDVAMGKGVGGRILNGMLKALVRTFQQSYKGMVAKRCNHPASDSSRTYDDAERSCTQYPLGDSHGLHYNAEILSMSYNILVFDPGHASRERHAFLLWWDAQAD